MADIRPDPQAHLWWVPVTAAYPGLNAVATGAHSFWPSFLCNIGVYSNPYEASLRRRVFKPIPSALAVWDLL